MTTLFRKFSWMAASQRQLQRYVVLEIYTYFTVHDIPEKQNPGPWEDPKPYEDPGPYEDAGPYEYLEPYEDPGSYEDSGHHIDPGP